MSPFLWAALALLFALLVPAALLVASWRAARRGEWRRALYGARSAFWTALGLLLMGLVVRLKSGGGLQVVLDLGSLPLPSQIAAAYLPLLCVGAFLLERSAGRHVAEEEARRREKWERRIEEWEREAGGSPGADGGGGGMLPPPRGG